MTIIALPANGSVCKFPMFMHLMDARTQEQALECLMNHWGERDFVFFREPQASVPPNLEPLQTKDNHPRTVEITVTRNLPGDDRELTVKPLTVEVELVQLPSNMTPILARYVPEGDGFVERLDPSYALCDIPATVAALKRHPNVTDLRTFCQKAGPVFVMVHAAIESPELTPWGRGFIQGNLELLGMASLLTGSAHLSGADKLDQDAINAPGHHLHEKHLLPKVVSHQLDFIINRRILHPIQEGLYQYVPISLAGNLHTCLRRDPRAVVIAHALMSEWVALFSHDRHRLALQRGLKVPYALPTAVEAVQRSANMLAIRAHSVARMYGYANMVREGKLMAEVLRWVRVAKLQAARAKDEGEGTLAQWHRAGFWLLDQDDTHWLPPVSY